MIEMRHIRELEHVRKKAYQRGHISGWIYCTEDTLRRKNTCKKIRIYEGRYFKNEILEKRHKDLTYTELRAYIEKKAYQREDIFKIDIL